MSHSSIIRTGIAFLAALVTMGCETASQLPLISPPDVPSLTSTRSIPSNHGLEWVAISPDGKWLGTSSTGDEVYIREISTGKETAHHGLDSSDNTFDAFFSGGSGFAWLADSSGILITRGVRKRDVYGASFISVEGNVSDYPPISLPDAPLSGLLYLGNEGKAIATLGSYGQFHGRDKSSETPTLAFVDVRENRILQSVTYAEVFPADSDDTPLIHMSSGVQLPDGRLKFVAVFSAHGPQTRFLWLVWTQGEQPKIIHQSEEIDGSIIEMSPDGNGIISAFRLMASSPCADDAPCNSASSPTTGVIARYHDARDGRVLWQINATANGGYGLTKPTFSPDGQHVLLGWPTLGQNGMPVVAKTSDGTIVKKVLSASPQYITGFTADGRGVWVQGYETLEWFDFDVPPTL